MIRPGGGDAFDVNRSVHWHVLSNFAYLSPDDNSAVDRLRRRRPATTATVVGVHRAGQDRGRRGRPAGHRRAQGDRERRRSTATTATTASATTSRTRASGLDYQLSTGAIDPSLPYIKREGMRILWSGFPDDATADAEIDKLADFYELNYPDVVRRPRAPRSTQAIDELKVLYRLTATPEMKVTAATYPEQHRATLDWPGLLPLPRRRPLHGGGRRRDQGDDPVHLRHLPHVPADRAGRRQPAARRAAQHAPTTPCGSSTTRTSRRAWTRAARAAASATPGTTA